MAERLIKIIAPSSEKEDLISTANKHDNMSALWVEKLDDQVSAINLVIAKQSSQKLIDDIQNHLEKCEPAHITIQALEAHLCYPQSAEKPDKDSSEDGAVLREELQSQLQQGATLDINYILLVLLSTIVASIGLVENNVAVLVGAMVIAPFLGPNLALTFAVALARYDLAFKAVKTLLVGSAISYIFAMLVGQFWSFEEVGAELYSRATVDYSSAILALASGAAAILSLSKGISSVMVGVMVAVALLPPLTASAMFLSHGMFSESLSAALLLMVNIVCINFSGLLMVMFKGIGPRKWWEKRKAKKAVYIYSAMWGAMLLILLAIIWYRRGALPL